MDSNLFSFFHSLAGRWSAFDGLIVFFAKFLPFILVIAALVFIFSRKSQKQAIVVLSITAMSVILSRGLITEIIRFFYNRPRPFEALGFTPLISESSGSFPSGHAAFFFALATAMFYFNKKLGFWFFIFALLNGLARIIAGVHWPTDVLAGAILGIVSLMIIEVIFGRKLGAAKNTHENYAG